MMYPSDSMERFVIFNADDFGMTAQVNAAILRAHREGVLTSTSLMAAEPGFAEAVEIARQNPTLGVGLHLVTTFDRALLPHSEIPRITTPEGRFFTNPVKTGLLYNFSKTAQAQLRREMTAQFERFAASGLDWSHVDGHQHYHLHPFVWDTLLDLCDTFGVHRLRIPQEPIRPHLRTGGDGPNGNTISYFFLSLQRRRALRTLQQRKTLAGKPVFFCDSVYGTLQTGNINEDYLMTLLDRIEGQSVEIYSHPGTEYACKLAATSPDAAFHDAEIKGLLAPEVQVKIAALNLRTGRYADAEAFVKSRK